jgi:hypothetical protein
VKDFLTVVGGLTMTTLGIILAYGLVYGVVAKVFALTGGIIP